MKNKILNQDLKLNLIGKVMDRDRLYMFIKKISPFFWYVRPSTKFVLKKLQKKELTCIEVGVDYALNSMTLLKFLPVKKLYLIDPYLQKLDNISGDERYKSAQRYLQKYKDKIEFIRKTSDEAINLVPNNVDFIYLDGNHDYEFVKKDIELYFPKVRKGGVLAGHDFWGNETGVCRAVIEFVNKNNLKLYGGFTDWWVIKE